MKLEHPIFQRFFLHLQECGGCVGLRNQEQCKYAAVCAFVERRAEEGEIDNSEDADFTIPYSSDLSLQSRTSLSSGTSPSGVGPCTAEC